VEYDPHLLDELARCYVQAALTELLRDATQTQRYDKTPMTTKDTSPQDKDEDKDASWSVHARTP
jgi:hypothetical protein